MWTAKKKKKICEKLSAIFSRHATVSNKKGDDLKCIQELTASVPKRKKKPVGAYACSFHAHKGLTYRIYAHALK